MAQNARAAGEGLCLALTRACPAHYRTPRDHLPPSPVPAAWLGFRHLCPKRLERKAQVSLGGEVGRVTSILRSTALAASQPQQGQPGKACDTRQARVRRPRPSPAGRPPRVREATPHLARAPRSPTPEQGSGLAVHSGRQRPPEENRLAPRALWSQLARCWQSGDSGPRCCRSVFSLRACCTEAG